MYLILMVTDRYGVGGISEKIIGYKKTFDEADRYVKEETPKLEFNENICQVYYRFKKIEEL